jgi:hypothetical protein
MTSLHYRATRMLLYSCSSAARCPVGTCAIHPGTSLSPLVSSLSPAGGQGQAANKHDKTGCDWLIYTDAARYWSIDRCSCIWTREDVGPSSADQSLSHQALTPFKVVH